jgi:similar to stage IV sporulation protein
MHYKTIRIEGFEIHKLLSQCLKEGIGLKNVRILNDCEFIADISGKDWVRLTRLAGSKYRLSVTRERGLKPLAIRILSNRSAIAGFILFLLVIFLQTSFISEIRVYGYESLTEREILEHLQDAGLYVGCSRSIDPDRVEIEMYRSLDVISWIGISFKGGLAEVTIVEGTEPVDRVEDSQPCHIVAAKEGYIEKTIAREGKEVVAKDDFVRVGDVLISGILEIEDKTYSRDPDSAIYRHVHADGEVYAKTVYRFICYQETHNLEKRKTGKSIPGIRLTLGNHTLNTSGLLAPFDTSVYEEKKILDLLWPVPLELAINRVSELELYREKRTREQIEKQAKRQTRELIQNNIPESAQILNKSLKFLPEENIIKVIIMVEALEQIGQKRAFIPQSLSDVQ